MTTLREAAQQALEALEYRDGDGADQWKADVITALRAALAHQAEPEPQDAELSAALGWPGGISDPVLDRKVLLQKVAALKAQVELVEPVAWGVDWGRDGDRACASIVKKRADGSVEIVAVEYAPYTAPPQRKPLTDEEIKECLPPDAVRLPPGWAQFARAVERKVRGEA